MLLLRHGTARPGLAARSTPSGGCCLHSKMIISIILGCAPASSAHAGLTGSFLLSITARQQHRACC